MEKLRAHRARLGLGLPWEGCDGHLFSPEVVVHHDRLISAKIQIPRAVKKSNRRARIPGRGPRLLAGAGAIGDRFTSGAISLADIMLVKGAFPPGIHSSWKHETLLHDNERRRPPPGGGALSLKRRRKQTHTPSSHHHKSCFVACICVVFSLSPPAFLAPQTTRTNNFPPRAGSTPTASNSVRSG